MTWNHLYNRKSYIYSFEARLAFIQEYNNIRGEDEPAQDSRFKELCKKHGIMPTTAWRWLKHYEDGYICIDCGEKPFKYLSTKICEECKRKKHPKRNWKYEYMDKIYSEGQLPKSHLWDLEGYLIIDLLEEGKSVKDIAQQFNKSTHWVYARVKGLGKSVLDYHPQKQQRKLSKLLREIKTLITGQ